MIVNGYAVLDAFLSLLRAGLGLLVVPLALASWRTWRRASLGEERKALEDRGYLLFLLAGLLLTFNILSWPTFYLLLQSYVSQWPGVMCIYGVTRIGEGSLGASRFLPALVTALQVLKPALVFASGAWLVLYLANRRTRTAPLTGRVLGVLTVVGLLAVADATAELAYLVIPKKEEFASAGCCTEVFDAESHAARFLPQALVGASARPWLYAAYLTFNLGMALALHWASRPGRTRSLRAWLLGPLLLGAGLCLLVNAVFLVEVVAPHLLHLPYHHCPYDLVPGAPESLLAVALFLGGTFAVGWACVAAWLGQHAETRSLLPALVTPLLRLGLLGYLGALVMTSVELALT